MGYVLTIVVTMIATAAVVRFIARIKITALVYYIVEKRIHRTNKRGDGTVHRYCIKENCG